MEWKELTCINEKFVNVFANENGVIKSVDKNNKECFYKDRLSHDGYKRVVIKGIEFTQHRVIALAFIPNVENKPTVDHINGIKTDNRVCNLRWATRKEQVCNNLYKSIRGKKVQGFDENGKLIKEFVSIAEAHRNGYDSRALNRILYKKIHTYKSGNTFIPKKHKNLYWKFAECND